MKIYRTIYEGWLEMVGQDVGREGFRFAGEYSRRSLLKFGGVGAVAVLGSGLLVACGGDGGRSAGGDTIRIALTGAGTDTLNPAKLVSLPDSAFNHAVFDTLFEIDPDLKPRPRLLESFDFSADAKVWTLRLRSGVKWHDGSEVSADDLLFTIAGWSDKKHGAYSVVSPFIDFGSVKKVDALSVQVPLKLACADLGGILANPRMALVKAGSVADNPSPVGTGPFKVKSFRPGGQSEFVRNEDYWKDGQPYVNALVIDGSYRDDNARINAVQSGSVHAAPSVPADVAKAMEGSSRVNLLRAAGTQFNAFTMHLDKAPFDDVRVRQAMRLIVDREQTVKSSLNGYGTVLSDLGPAGLQYFAEDLKRSQDLDQAKSLLKAAGRSDLTVAIDTAPYAGFEQQATLFKEEASKIGVMVELNRHPANAYFSSGWPNYPFGQTRYSSSVTSMSAFYMSTLITNPSFAETGWGDPKSDALLLDAIGDVNPETAAQKWHEVQQLQFDQGGYIIWGGADFLDATNPSLKGLKPSRAGFLGNWAFDEMQLA